MWRILGQEGTVERLSRSIAEASVHHAYLFLGPEHVGKRTFALDLACALNCVGDTPPCGVCSACTRILGEKHADIYAVSLDSDPTTQEQETDEETARRRTRVSTQQMEDLQHAATLPPYEGKWKVLLVEHADHMSPAAANRILKALEEPPPHIVWMLLAESEDRLLDTIVSRCQRIDVKPMALPELERHLASSGASPEQARLVARVSRGRTGWALSAFQDDRLMTERAARVESTIQLISMTYGARFDLSRELDALYRREPSRVLETLEQWTTWWRDLLLFKTGCAESLVNVDYVNDIEEQAARLSLEQIREYIGRLTGVRQDLDLNVIPRLVFDSLVYTMPRIAKPGGDSGVARGMLPSTIETE
jgi:DNA polymerase III subunit delta'